MGGVRNEAAEEDWCWDLNPGATVIPERGYVVLGEKGERTTWFGGRKEREPHGFGREKGERTTLLWQSGGPMVAT